MTKLFTTCCIVAVVGLCLFQHVEGRRSPCIARCGARCKILRDRRQAPFPQCLRKCARISRECKTCAGPNECITCASGYQLSLFSKCVDTDECTTSNGRCSAHATCTNTVGSYRCSCNPGYTGDGKICTDINECATNNGGCATGATCTNVVGSYTCACNNGYTGNGTICTGWILQTKSGKYMRVNTPSPATPLLITDKNVYHTTTLADAISVLKVPCLNTTALSSSARCVSMMLEYWPQAYLYQSGYAMLYGPYSSSTQQAAWSLDTTYYMHTDKFFAGYVAFESFKFAGLYMYADTGGSGYKLGNAVSATFNNDASFLLIPRTV